MTRRTSTSLVLVAIVLLALNLRPTAVSVGPVLDEVRAGLGMTTWQAGLLTSLPVLAFAAFGALAPAAAARFGPHRVTLVALVVAAVGLVGRALVPDVAGFLVLSMLALAGMAMANVLLPSLVRRHFPGQIGTVTSVYTTALSVGLTSALLLTVPLAAAFGSWRAGLGAWAVVAILAVAPWVRLARTDAPSTGTGSGTGADPPGARVVTFRDVARTPVGWAMAGFFGLQSMQAYAIFGWFATLWRDAGYGATAAGALVGLVAGVSIPLSLWTPALVARPGDQRWLIALIVACYPVAYLGLAVSPYRLAVLWAVVLGVATATFPVVLVLIGLRSRTPEGTAALSGFTQSLGYLLAAVGPFGTGALHDAFGGWTVPLTVGAGLSVPLLLLGWYVGRPVTVEDQLVRSTRRGEPDRADTGAPGT